MTQIETTLSFCETMTRTIKAAVRVGTIEKQANPPMAGLTSNPKGAFNCIKQYFITRINALSESY